MTMMIIIINKKFRHINKHVCTVIVIINRLLPISQTFSLIYKNSSPSPFTLIVIALVLLRH